MKKWILPLFATMALCAATPDPQTEKDVMAAMNAYKQAMLTKDADALSKVLSDDLVYTHSNNLHQDKAAVVAALKAPGGGFDSIDFHQLAIKVYGNTALVVGDVDFKSGNSLSKLNVLHVLVKGPEGWQLVARQAVRYTDTAPR